MQQSYRMVAGASSGRWSRAQVALIVLLFFSTVLNYLDRQALSILAPIVQRDLGIDDIAYGQIVQLFLIAYAFAFIVAGRLTDWLGIRVALALFVGWWSLANALTGFVRSAAELGAARFALGLGEAGNYTVGPKAVSEHFPPERKATAFGIYTSGAMVGATIAPPLIGGLALAFGWRWAFIATGLLGAVWLAAWLVWGPRRASADETRRPRGLSGGEWAQWRDALSDQATWLFVLARALADPVWYFYLFWFPKFLSDERGVSFALIASTAWIVYLAADVGSIGGGVASGRLIRRGWTTRRARLTIMALAAALAPLGAISAFDPPIVLLFVIGALVACVHQAFQVNIGTLIVDRVPEHRIGTTFGLIACGSALGGILSTAFVASAAQAGNFRDAFLWLALLHPAAFAVAYLASRRPLPRREAELAESKR